MDRAVRKWACQTAACNIHIGRAARCAEVVCPGNMQHRSQLLHILASVSWCKPAYHC
jgi:hypothetical protein